MFNDEGLGTAMAQSHNESQVRDLKKIIEALEKRIRKLERTAPSGTIKDE